MAASSFSGPYPAPAEIWPLPEAASHPPAEKWEEYRVGSISQPALGYYPAPRATANGASVVICPGGGYTWLSMEHEGTTIAAWLNSHGISAFLLKSRLRDHGHPAPLRDACAALRRIRAAAPRLGLRADRIGIIGFSAGGHLAASAATLHADPATRDADPALAAISARPDFALLIYPVITFEPPSAHLGSRDALLGARATSPELVAQLSLHRAVTADTPPTCLVHAQDDAAVPVENALLYYAALRSAGVPSEMHLYARGGHGFGLKPGLPAPLADWPARCADWMRANAWLA